MTAPPRAAPPLPAQSAARGSSSWPGGLDENNLWISYSEDGLNWSSQVELKFDATSNSPAIAHTDSLKVWYMAWEGLDQKNIWVSYSKDGQRWSPQKELNDRSTNQGPGSCAGGEYPVHDLAGVRSEQHLDLDPRALNWQVKAKTEEEATVICTLRGTGVREAAREPSPAE